MTITRAVLFIYTCFMYSSLTLAGSPFVVAHRGDEQLFPENSSEAFLSAATAKADYIVAIGGGSSMDTAKAIGIIIANPELQAFFCINDPSALGAAAAVKSANKTGEIGVYSIDASPDGKQALLDGEFTAVAAQVPLQIAEYSFDEATRYLGGDTEIAEKKVYLDSHLVLEDEAKETISDWQ